MVWAGQDRSGRARQGKASWTPFALPRLALLPAKGRGGQCRGRKRGREGTLRLHPDVPRTLTTDNGRNHITCSDFLQAGCEFWHSQSTWLWAGMLVVSPQLFLTAGANSYLGLSSQLNCLTYLQELRFFQSGLDKVRECALYQLRCSRTL